MQKMNPSKDSLTENLCNSLIYDLFLIFFV